MSPYRSTRRGRLEAEHPGRHCCLPALGPLGRDCGGRARTIWRADGSIIAAIIVTQIPVNRGQAAEICARTGVHPAHPVDRDVHVTSAALEQQDRHRHRVTLNPERCRSRIGAHRATRRRTSASPASTASRELERRRGSSLPSVGLPRLTGFEDRLGHRPMPLRG